MTKEEVIHILEHPNKINLEHSKQLGEVANKYPYFQSLRCVHLKLLHYQKSFLYNTELKEVAIQTPSREVLFDFITNVQFHQLEIAKQNDWNFTIDIDQHDFGFTDELLEKIQDPEGLFEPKVNEEIVEDEKKGKPFNFTKEDTFSFNEWLQLTKISKITPSIEEENETNRHKKDPKLEKIDAFLRANPKIKRGNEASDAREIKLRTQPTSEFMTETLARVYEEQKKYKEAIQAYTILILNNPEKSSFFADQINRIEQILENNK